MANSQQKQENSIDALKANATTAAENMANNYTGIKATPNLPDDAVTQVYGIVNEVAQQTMGRKDINVIDTASLIALGTTMENMVGLVEAFTKTLAMRIGRTIFVYREYRNNLRDLMFSDMEYGGIVQKIDAEMPEFIEDEAFNLVEGKSVDPYIVRKPKIHQTFFYGMKPYSNFITVWKKDLKVAFQSAGGMHSFISMLRGKVLNMIELSFENLGRLAMANFIAISKPSQRIHLITEYQNATGKTVTPTGAMYDEQFLRFAIGRFNLIAKNMKTMSVLYNGQGRERHTPDEKQIFVTLNELTIAMETQVQYAAFHEQLVSKRANIEVPYWQSAQSPKSIHVLARTSGDETGTPEDIQIDNIVGMIFDREALGTFRNDPDVETTPMNARGLYTNTFWHEDQLWFNDTAENGVIFLLD